MHRIALAVVLAAAAGLAQGQARTYAYEADLAQPAKGARFAYEVTGAF